MKIAVLGAGIAGITTAYFLARDGHEVIVVDRRSEAASETSHANGGIVGATQVEPWAQPGLPLKILGWLGREDAPLLLRLREVPRIFGWGRRFLRRCTKSAYLDGLSANMRLTRYSLQMFARLREEANIAGREYDLNRHGALKLYFTQESFAEAVSLAHRLAELGGDVEPITARAAAALEPALARQQPNIQGALHFPGEEIGDCRKFALFLDGACRRLGVSFRYGAAVRELTAHNGRIAAAETSAGAITADGFVIAQASFTPVTLRSVQVRVPIIPVKGVTVTTLAAPWDEAIRGAVMDHARLFGIARIGDRLRISGSAEITGYDTAPSPARCEALIRNVLALFPGFAASLAAGKPAYWAGVRPVTPDGMPILGQTPIPNLFINSGHGPQGWSTSCGCASIVADVVSGRTPAISLDGLGLDRFT